MCISMAETPLEARETPLDPGTPPRELLVDEERADLERDGISGLRIEAAATSVAGVALGGLAAAIGTSIAEGWLAAAVCVVAIAVGAGFAASMRVSHSLAFMGELTSAARRLESGDRIERVDERSLGRFAIVGRSFNAIFDSLGAVAQRVLQVVAGVQDLPDRITVALEEIDASSQAQEEAVEESASLMANINSSIRDIDTRVDNLSRAAEESASSILEMGSSVEEVARNAGSLQESVEISTSSVHEMSASIRQVAQNAESVQRIAEETAVSMTEMDRAVQEVNGHAREASALTERVSEGADQGSQAVGETIRDIERIHSLTDDAKQKLEKLVGRVGEIADILGTIGDINSETNLLSLNAAIIAAQAGEQGKAFLVVANHVKVLAQRTAASTKDIEQLLHSIEAESDSAMTSMSAGVEAIEQGVSRSRLAGRSLQTIRESAAESSQRVAEIARAADEQTRTSSTVARAAQETSSQVQQITTAMSEQTRAGDQMMQSSEAALELCKLVYRSIEEQRDTGRYITESTTRITEMIHGIKQNTAEHSLASEAVREAVMRLLDNAQKSCEQIPQVNAMLGELRTSAQTIVADLTRFESAPSGFARDRSAAHRS
jgi:methyl-accepting chemotaxis protein